MITVFEEMPVTSKTVDVFVFRQVVSVRVRRTVRVQRKTRRKRGKLDGC